MASSWVVLSVGVSFMMALLVQVNHHLNIRGNSLILIRSVFGLAFLAPFLPEVTWPTEQSFYVYLLLASLSAFIADLILFETARRYGGRLTSMYLPVKIFIAFGLWLVIDQAYTAALLQTPIITLGILICLGFSAAGILQMRGCDRSWPAFRRVVFVGLFFALLDVFIKLGMEGVNQHQAAILFICIGYVVHLFLGALLALHRDKPHQITTTWPKGKLQKVFYLLMVGVFIGGLSTLASYVIAVALSLSPNPGYVGALMMLSIVWLSLFNRLRGFDDRAPWLSVVFLTLSAFGLIILTANQ